MHYGIFFFITYTLWYQNVKDTRTRLGQV